MQMQVHLILWQGDSSGGGNSTVVAVPVDSWTTVKDMHQMVTLEANVKDGGLFALYAGMVGDNYEGEVLDGDCRVLDVVAHWQDSDGGGSGRLFIYKVHLYLYPDRKDNAAVDLFFRQGMYDIANTRYPVPDDTYCAAMLAALQAQAQFGDYAEDGDFGEEVSAEALEVWKTFAGNTPRHAKARYLDIIQAWKFYGSKFFTVELQKDKTTCHQCPVCLRHEWQGWCSFSKPRRHECSRRVPLRKHPRDGPGRHRQKNVQFRDKHRKLARPTKGVFPHGVWQRHPKSYSGIPTRPQL